jgi:hypothetical protein
LTSQPLSYGVFTPTIERADIKRRRRYLVAGGNGSAAAVPSQDHRCDRRRRVVGRLRRARLKKINVEIEPAPGPALQTFIGVYFVMPN